MVYYTKEGFFHPKTGHQKRSKQWRIEIRKPTKNEIKACMLKDEMPEGLLEHMESY